MPAISIERQVERLGPVFSRLTRTLSSPAALSELRADPAAVLPERALVFELASEVADFYRAMRAIDLELVGLDETEVEPDLDVHFGDESDRKKDVPVRLYFTMPDAQALRELVSVWNLYQRGELPQGKKGWAPVFAHLRNLRTWGPKDRLTQEVLADWSYRLKENPDGAVRFEVEFFFRRSNAARAKAEASLLADLKSLGGHRLSQSVRPEFAYHAMLVDVPAVHVRALMAANPSVTLVMNDEIMFFRPQAVVGAPVDTETIATNAAEGPAAGALRPPVAALLDGLPMTRHARLEEFLEVDDPDEFAARYGAAGEQAHGTAMASLMAQGNLDAPTPIRQTIHVRPVMYSVVVGVNGEREERMPHDELVVDLIWRAIIRMKEGEGDSAPTAPSVKVINLSLGNASHRFSNTISPWARLLDYLAWRYRLLFIVSAGNIRDAFPVPEAGSWFELEGATPEKREAMVLRSVMQQVAQRQLLSPAEAVNPVTIGACHDDDVPARRTGAMALTPYACAAIPNPSSALGPGFRRCIKPDLLFPGGREHVRMTTQSPTKVKPVEIPGSSFGLRVASPRGTTDLCYTSGTSAAAGLATNATIRIWDGLLDAAASGDEDIGSIPDDFVAVVLKALLAHGARWDRRTVEMLTTALQLERGMHWQHKRDALSRLLGYGRPDVERVLSCTEQRATLVGWGLLAEGEVDRFRVPLPSGLQGVTGFRAVSVTVGWLTPVDPFHQMYRMAKLEAGPGSDPHFSLGIDSAKCQPAPATCERGTLFHRRWEGTDAVAFVDDGELLIDVGCKALTGKLDAAIPYGIAVSIEVGEDVTIAIYGEIRTRLRAAQRVGVRAG
jgi:hypothetical protein